MIAAPGDVLDALVDAHRERWTHSDELAALTLEKLDELLIAFGRAWGDPKKMPRKAPRPYRYPRPVEPPRRKSTSEEIRAFFRRR